jgi:hypothetical protein
MKLDSRPKAWHVDILKQAISSLVFVFPTGIDFKKKLPSLSIMAKKSIIDEKEQHHDEH